MKQNWKYFLFALVSSLAIFLNLSLFQELKDLDYTKFYHLNLTMMSMTAILLFFWYKKLEKLNLAKEKVILTVLFAIFMLIGEAYVSAGTFTVIYKNPALLLLSIVKVMGYSFLFQLCFYYLDKFLGSIKPKDIKVKHKTLTWFFTKFEEHPFLVSLVVILVLWSIYLIAFYPIVLSPDPSFQIKQYFNVPTKYIDWVIQRDPSVFMTTHHPVIHTFLLGKCIELGRLFVNDNFGLFLYTLLQTVVFASVLAYTIKFAKQNGVKSKMRFLLLCLYALVPMFPFYAIAGVKDTYYTAFMILYVLFIFDIVKNYRHKKMSLKSLFYSFIVMLLVGLFRNNGLYVILLSFPFLLIFARYNFVKLGISFGLFLLCFFSFNNLLVPSLGISEGSIREVLSIPFQQTARYAIEHGDELTKQEIRAIDTLLTYDTLQERYDPEKSDPVKNEFNKLTTKEELHDYLKVWWKGLLTHPTTYIDATLHNSYGYFYPNSHKWYLYASYDKRITENNLVDYHFNGLKGLRSFLAGFGNAFMLIPFFGLISTIGAGSWALLIIAVYLITLKKYRYLLPLLPLFASLLICIASPVNTYFRYAMPYLFCLPVISMLLLSIIKKEQAGAKEGTDEK